MTLSASSSSVASSVATNDQKAQPLLQQIQQLVQQQQLLAPQQQQQPQVQQQIQQQPQPQLQQGSKRKLKEVDQKDLDTQRTEKKQAFEVVPLPNLSPVYYYDWYFYYDKITSLAFDPTQVLENRGKEILGNGIETKETTSKSRKYRYVALRISPFENLQLQEDILTKNDLFKMMHHTSCEILTESLKVAMHLPVDLSFFQTCLNANIQRRRNEETYSYSFLFYFAKPLAQYSLKDTNTVLRKKMTDHARRKLIIQTGNAHVSEELLTEYGDHFIDVIELAAVYIATITILGTSTSDTSNMNVGNAVPADKEGATKEQTWNLALNYLKEHRASVSSAELSCRMFGLPSSFDASAKVSLRGNLDEAMGRLEETFTFFKSQLQSISSPRATGVISSVCCSPWGQADLEIHPPEKQGGCVIS